MQTGKLRHRIRIEQNTTSQDPQTGAMIDGWAEFATVWAEIVPASGREFIAASASQSAVSGRIKIRKLDGINASMRAVNVRTGAVYNIEAVLPDPVSGEHWMTLPFSTGVNDG